MQYSQPHRPPSPTEKPHKQLSDMRLPIRLLRRDELIAITNYSTTFYRQESGNSLNSLEERKAAEHDPPQHFRLPQYAE